MVVKPVKKSAAPKKTANDKVKKDIAKTSKKKIAGVSKDFEIDEDARHSGKVTYYDLKRGFGFIELAEKGVVPEDKVMVHWRAITSEDRWPFLQRDMEIELALVKRREGRDQWSIKAKEVTLPGGESINLQDSRDSKREFIGDQNMRYLGNVKFFDWSKGFGYVTLQEGYAVDEDVPNELRISRDEVNSGNDPVRLTNDMEVEFGIVKSKKGVYQCYNVTLPGGMDITRLVTEKRENVTSAKYQGVVQFWNFAGSYGMITPDDMKKFPADMRKALEEDHAKRQKKSKKDDIQLAVYFRRADKVEANQITKHGQKVSFKLYTDNQGVGACEVECI